MHILNKGLTAGVHKNFLQTNLGDNQPNKNVSKIEYSIEENQIRKYSTFLVVRKIQIKDMRFHYTPVNLAKYLKSVNTQ